MRTRAALAVTTLALLATPAAAGLQARPAREGADPTGLAWTLPAGWQPVDPRLNDLAGPAPQLAAATFGVRRTARDRDCRLDGVHAQVPRRGALVLLLEDREAAARPRSLRRLPARPRPFRLPAPTEHECFGTASVVHWAEHGRSFIAVALFGERASRRAADALLDSLVVAAIPPPPPPAGWRVVVSGAYDSIRVPPGWSARALERVHTTGRPRTLFRLASGDGRVVVRVTELRRDRGRRFATRVFTRPGARDRDRERARVAISSFGHASD